jgi:hypothetical protein
MLTAFGPAAADDGRGQEGDGARSVTGVVLSVGYATRDMLIYQDSGSVIALYGLTPSRLREIGAGDRVAVTFGADLEVLKIEKKVFTTIRYD